MILHIEKISRLQFGNNLIGWKILTVQSERSKWLVPGKRYSGNRNLRH